MAIVQAHILAANVLRDTTTRTPAIDPNSARRTNATWTALPGVLGLVALECSSNALENANVTSTHCRAHGACGKVTETAMTSYHAVTQPQRHAPDPSIKPKTPMLSPLAVGLLSACLLIKLIMLAIFCARRKNKKSTIEPKPKKTKPASGGPPADAPEQEGEQAYAAAPVVHVVYPAEPPDLPEYAEVVPPLYPVMPELPKWFNKGNTEAPPLHINPKDFWSW